MDLGCDTSLLHTLWSRDFVFYLQWLRVLMSYDFLSLDSQNVGRGCK